MEKSLDQSQRAAEPTPRVNPNTLVGRLKGAERVQDNDEAAAENRARAAAEISMIFELKDSTAFKWFEEEFIDKPYRASFDALRDPSTPIEELPTVRARYAALKAVKIGIIEREIAHRDQLDPNDPERLRLWQQVRQM